MSTALFFNGIYDGVFATILTSQLNPGGEESFLQPYSTSIIRVFKKRSPSRDNPIKFFASITANLSQIIYAGEIVSWEDKRDLTEARRETVRRHLEAYQPGEVNLFLGTEDVGRQAVNLMTVRAVRRLDISHSTAILRKVSDGLPLKRRTRSGGWSEIFDPGDFIYQAAVTWEQNESELAANVSAAEKLTDIALRQRLLQSPAVPEKLQVISLGYRRNPYVIIAVHRRANGVCEYCGKEAPFVKKSDGSPYLEIHHWTPLSQGGEDTVSNAAALCPNCHRQIHHGLPSGEERNHT